MATKTWLEVAMNGPWGSQMQPGIPVRVADIVEQGVACGEHTAHTRFAAIEELARRGLLEWAVVDPGSVNLDEFVYLNPYYHIRHGLALAAARLRQPPRCVAR